MTSNDDYILEILENVGLITREQAVTARQLATQDDEGVVDVLAREGVVDKLDVLKALAAQFGMETITLTGLDIPREVLDMVPGDVAQRYKVVPVFKNENVLTVALGDPLDVDTLDGLRYVLKTNVEGVVAPPEEIEKAIANYYGRATGAVESMLTEITEGTLALPDEVKNQLVADENITEADAPIIKLVSLIIMEAFRNRASDIHLEPMPKKFRVRYRIDGVLHEVDSPPKRLQSAIISRVKIMANMSIAEKRVPQDGRIQINVMGRDLDLRVSSIPTNHGESIVMRILDKAGIALGLPQLGFFSDDQQVFERLIGLSDGIILVTGPTGSGKTTTLYACLNAINKPDRKIITVEDPVEYQMSGINQVQVRTDIGMTFAAALRSILRQAPNIIMIGEIRDMETAEIAVNASLTGHLVFSTLHTNDAPSAVTRLIDIGVKPFLVASSIRAIMAQRLVRRICDKCKEPYTPEEAELRLLGPAAQQLAAAQLFHGKGCADCAFTGYRGRLGIYEIFQIDDQVRNLIFDQVAAVELRTKARELGMRTLREDGLRKVVAGLTTVQEVLRVTMGDSD
ncbi:MAG TPA: type II secretion system ATPase GspE [Kiritimatiellia bacterium]|nr:type II secretion system ATPase GspE [Kiritimatiellia bacterium]OQC59725.1 MAG: Type II secretion system protein E [Verrucomicrobia bacterium ADurb.Bin018]HOD99425.1 type II secretion system ATPase GspE [Kiritimatiellia bacterium]HOE36088.1 type II secretion system ATPase GspE [Kiritimatiellia bacterium]HOR73512.1 type II secretion system ATPase GspE [Kiritimatiellia bacterium]